MQVQVLDLFEEHPIFNQVKRNLEFEEWSQPRAKSLIQSLGVDPGDDELMLSELEGGQWMAFVYGGCRPATWYRVAIEKENHL